MRRTPKALARHGVVTRIRANTTERISEAVRSYGSLRVTGSDTGLRWRRPVLAEAELHIESAGVLDHDVEDQVVVVSAGTTIAELQDSLSKKGQCLPLGLNAVDAGDRLGEVRGTIGGQLSLNLPHSFEAWCGSWRDWVLGLTIVRPDGTVSRCGSKAVKNVAGYDVMKLIIGARGTLGVVSEVILRTYPLQALPESDYVEGSGAWSDRGRVQRTLRSDFDAARSTYAERVIACHPRTSTLFVSCDETLQSYRFPDDWEYGWGLESGNVVVEDQTLRRLMERTKSIMDPGRKLNVGELL